jgi:hypothetical protein
MNWFRARGEAIEGPNNKLRSIIRRSDGFHPYFGMKDRDVTRSLTSSKPEPTHEPCRRGGNL